MEPEPQMDETGVEDVNAVTTAVFYSITSTQKGEGWFTTDDFCFDS